MSTGKQGVALILGEPDDPHTLSVCRELAALGRETLILDAWEPWQPITIALDHGLAVITQGSETLEVRSVWLRLKPRLGGGLSEAEAFALRERREFLMGLTTLSETTQLINDPWKQELARNKPIQLSVASRVGLSTPRTWISSDADRLAHAGATLGGTFVYKPLTWLASLDGRILMTNAVPIEEIVQHKQAIQRAPGIFQEVVRKRCEYRVTIVDGQIFSVRLYSQELKETALDWRRNQDGLRYEVCILPDQVNDRLMALMHKLGLRYAAIDLIESDDGEYIFLEANPAGNWLWLEERLGIPVSKAIAICLNKENSEEHT